MPDPSGINQPVTHDRSRPISGREALAAVAELQRQIDALRADTSRARQLGVLGVLASMISHEINNLMTPVLSYAQLALRSPDDTALTRRALERAVVGASRASQVADSILGIAKDAVLGEAGVDERTDLKAAVVCAIEHAAEELDRSGVSVAIAIDPPRTVRARAVVVEQIVLNLVLNACRAMKGSGGAIRITATSCDGSGTACSTWNRGDVALCVSDTGPGIPPGASGLLFDPFGRGNKGVPGTGLGLAICKGLAEAAGGSLGLVDHAGGGATFRIILPGG